MDRPSNKRRGTSLEWISGATYIWNQIFTDWGVVCGDGWSLLEAGVICRQLGLGYAAQVYQTNFFGGNKLPMAVSGVKCRGDERHVAECLHDNVLDCPGSSNFVCIRGNP